MTPVLLALDEAEGEPRLRVTRIERGEASTRCMNVAGWASRRITLLGELARAEGPGAGIQGFFPDDQWDRNEFIGASDAAAALAIHDYEGLVEPALAMSPPPRTLVYTAGSPLPWARWLNLRRAVSRASRGGRMTLEEARRTTSVPLWAPGAAARILRDIATGAVPAPAPGLLHVIVGASRRTLGGWRLRDCVATLAAVAIEARASFSLATDARELVQGLVATPANGIVALIAHQDPGSGLAAGPDFVSVADVAEILGSRRPAGAMLFVCGADAHGNLAERLQCAGVPWLFCVPRKALLGPATATVARILAGADGTRTLPQLLDDVALTGVS